MTVSFNVMIASVFAQVSGTTKGKDIFNMVDEFFKKNDLEW